MYARKRVLIKEGGGLILSFEVLSSQDKGWEEEETKNRERDKIAPGPVKETL